MENINRSTDISQNLTKLNDNEKLKDESHYLRGTIKQGLEETSTRALPGLDPLLLKFHGIYQQDNRDERITRAERKLEPNYQFMVRLRLPGGKCTERQWRGLSKIADRFGEGSLRITTRQTLQIHGVRKPKLKLCIQALETLGIDTIAACGDDNRGVVCGINPALSGLHQEVLSTAGDISTFLTPKTSAYPDIWYDRHINNVEEEPFYGSLYLPRKFKIGFAIPPLNDIDIFAQDLGFIAIADGKKLIGFNVCVGGGMGQLDNRDDSYPRIANLIGFIDKKDVQRLSEAVVSIQRDYGDRVDRHRARFKYTLDRLGIPWFLEMLTQRFGKQLKPAKPYHFDTSGDQFGWHQGDDQLWHLCLHIPNGRITSPLKDRLEGFFQQFGGGIRFTANQNLTLTNIDSAEKPQIEWRLSDLLLDHLLDPRLQQVHSLACVGFPTCGLAMAESERYLPQFLKSFEQLKEKHGLEYLPIKLRITGCPNGCARPYLAEVALTGRSPGKYNLYLGGGFYGQRLNKLYRSNLKENEIFDILDCMMARYKEEAENNEAFGDFLNRIEISDIN